MGNQHSQQMIQVHYAKIMPIFGNSLIDADWNAKHGYTVPDSRTITQPFTIENLPKTHAVIAYIDAPVLDLDAIYYAMQSENWSRNGEGNEIAIATDTHVSMSIGDIVYDPNRQQAWECSTFGWRLIL